MSFRSLVVSAFVGASGFRGSEAPQASTRDFFRLSGCSISCTRVANPGGFPVTYLSLGP